ncbi:hypothetical protein ACFSSB_12930 [Lacinutrix gracilariae]|uniref:Ferredoxin subunit of nitrite reductase or a ring-hydroxylating dioxygenase n=1 Tax=Lacinutrix gracilariae TaxID=1747198 RepID=A0ABW5K5L5_9FLAO
MKKLLLTVLTSFILIACSSSDNNYENEFLPSQSFDTGTTINTSFPQYNDLLYPGNHVVLYGYGLSGIVVYYSGSSYVAFELSDPNHYYQSCSSLTVNGVLATCGCEDENTYDILTGQPNGSTTGSYGLTPYFVEVNGSIIRVYNN